MMLPSIRVLAICVIRRGEEILGFEVPDDMKGVTGFRPLGGGIEYGESSRAAVSREMSEELGTEIRDLRLLGTLENIFTYKGDQGHEVVFVYEADLVDQTFYEKEEIEFEEPEVPGIVKAVWRSLSTFRRGSMPLYPEGLLELLDGTSPQE